MDSERESETPAEGGLPPILVVGMDRSLTLLVHLFTIIIAFERVVDGTLHSLLRLNVSLGLR